MLSVIYHFVIIALAAQCSAEKLNDSNNIAAEDKWISLHESIFNNKKPYPQFNETFQTLQSLKALYDGREDEPTKKRLVKVNSLLEIANFRADKCFIEYFTDYLANVIKSYSVNPKSMVPYLKHCERQQYAACEGQFSKKFDDKLNSLTFEQKSEVDSLHKILDSLGFNDEESIDPLAPRRRAMLAYLELTYGPLNLESEFTEGTSRVQKKFDEAIADKCEPFFNTLRVTASLYEGLFQHHEHLKANLSDTKQHWLNCFRMCRVIIDDSKGFIVSLYKNNYKPKAHKRKWLKKAKKALNVKRYMKKGKKDNLLLY